MSFDFFPRSFGVTESMYRFEIPSHSLSVPFLLVGQVTEPQILFDRTFISFHPVLIGHHVEDTLTLINKENRSFHYQFLERSFINGSTKYRFNYSTIIIWSYTSEFTFTIEFNLSTNRKSYIYICSSMSY